MKNGRWRVSVYQPNDAPRIRKVFKTREEARKFETITKGELAQGKTFYTKKEDPGNELFSNFLQLMVLNLSIRQIDFSCNMLYFQ